MEFYLFLGVGLVLIVILRFMQLRQDEMQKAIKDLSGQIVYLNTENTRLHEVAFKKLNFILEIIYTDEVMVEQAVKAGFPRGDVWEYILTHKDGKADPPSKT